MIDSHCHLNYSTIKDNIDNIILNAKNNNITSILSINTNPKDFIDHLKIIENYKNIFISYGLHPEEIKNDSQLSIEKILNNCKNSKVIGIGETGLDFYHSNDYIDNQYKIFETHIEASIKSSLPLIIHQRNSEKEIIDVLKNYQKDHKLSLVFHCFTGSKKLLDFCLENNYYISLSGIITFKNAQDLRNVISNLPLDNLLIETDSPFLAPEPVRGKQNEPAYVKHIAEYLSQFYSLPFKKLIEITDNNFYNLFSKAKRYIHFE